MSSDPLSYTTTIGSRLKDTSDVTKNSMGRDQFYEAGVIVIVWGRI